ncbi:MAG TPA: GNAT family N-acetyltransferase [Candidatus Eisenbacteria bacterium]|jgi:mycothiol synthase
MALQIAPYRADDLATLRSLVRDPALVTEFDTFAEPAYLDHKLADALRDRDATLIARSDGEPAGFCFAFLLPRADGGSWAAFRIGVAGRFRRRGVASALLAAARGDLEHRAIAGGLHEIVMSAWRPNEPAAAFAARHGFQHVRGLWKMECAAERPEHEWPPGVTVRVFDGSESALADWTDAYNSSFAQHYHFVPATLDMVRHITEAPLFIGDGHALAYRAGRCVGFCHNERVGKEPEIGVLGVVPEARGIGLGRALLRWGVGYFRARGEERVTLRVDGENETALALYRSEGFAVTRTRDLWAIVPGEAPAAVSAAESRSAAGTTPPPAGRP